MTDDMDAFENEVRAMLHRRAADIDGSAGSDPAPDVGLGLPGKRAGRQPHRILLTAAAVVALVAVVGAGMVLRDADDPVEIDSAAPTATPQELPTWFDHATATVAFDTNYDEPRAAAEDYLRARFPDFPAPDVAVTDLAAGDGLATAQWGVQDQAAESPYRGEILLRLVDDSWDVVASTTEGVHLSGLERRDGLLVGEVTSDGGQVGAESLGSGGDMLALDVLGLDGEPVPDAPEPDGYPGAQYRFGTAGVSDTEPNSAGTAVPVNIEIGDTPVIVRAQHVGGTLLSVAEVVFPGPGSEPTPEQTACSDRALDQLDPQTDAMVYLDPTVSPARAREAVEAMDQEPGVAVVRFLDHQQVYEQFKILFRDQPEIVESVTPDILPPTIEVNLDTSADVDAFVADTMHRADVRDVVSRDSMAESFVSECGEIGRPRATVPPSIPPTTVPTVTTTIQSGDDAISELVGRTFSGDTVEVGGELRPLVPDTTITLSFPVDSASGAQRISWNAGCNNWGARLVQTEPALQLDQVGSTYALCGDDLTEQERWLHDLFTSGPMWTLDGDTLTLTNGDTVIKLATAEEPAGR